MAFERRTIGWIGSGICNGCGLLAAPVALCDEGDAEATLVQQRLGYAVHQLLLCIPCEHAFATSSTLVRFVRS